jgi:hypothetical protein
MTSPGPFAMLQPVHLRKLARPPRLRPRESAVLLPQHTGQPSHRRQHHGESEVYEPPSCKSKCDSRQEKAQAGFAEHLLDHLQRPTLPQSGQQHAPALYRLYQPFQPAQQPSPAVVTLVDDSSVSPSSRQRAAAHSHARCCPTCRCLSATALPCATSSLVSTLPPCPWCTVSTVSLTRSRAALLTTDPT